MIDKSECDFEMGRTARFKDLAMHKWEHWGDIIPAFTQADGVSFDNDSKTNTKKSLKRYNPFEWLNIDFIFDESGLQEAYSDIKQQNLIMEKQGKEFRKYKGFFAWFTGMIVINEDVIKKATSSDGYIYLLYLKSCFVFFLMLSLIGILILWPFYWQAAYDNNASSKLTFLQMITVFEISYSEWRLWLVFFLTFAYSVAGYRFVYSLVIKMKDLKDYEEEIRDDDHDFKLAKRSVMVKNIPSYLATRHWNSLITQVIRERYSKEFEGVTTLGRYHIMYKLLNERIDIASKLNKHMNSLIQNQNCVRTEKEKAKDKVNEQMISDYQAQLKIKSNN